jgi:Zn finger protein HypA/HybF involved in hydrogenase expression
MNAKCKHCNKEFEYFASDFCCEKCAENYYMNGEKFG